MFSWKTCRGKGLAKMGVGELWGFFPFLCLPPGPCKAGLGASPEGSMQGRAGGGREGQHHVKRSPGWGKK